MHIRRTDNVEEIEYEGVVSNRPELTREHAEEVVEKINCIYSLLERGEYVEGCRNNVAVDLDILCYMIGIDPKDVAVKAWHPNWPKGLTTEGYKDLLERLEVVDDYLWSWENRGGVELFMVADGEWSNPTHKLYKLV